MSARYVYRLVVKSWPTENGEPFFLQGFDYWAGIVNAFEEGGPVPAWLPADFKRWLWNDPNAKQFGYLIGDYEPASFDGDPGADERLLYVPHATNRRYFSKAGLPERLADLVSWGCEAHIERALIGDWEVLS